MLKRLATLIAVYLFTIFYRFYDTNMSLDNYPILISYLPFNNPYHKFTEIYFNC